MEYVNDTMSDINLTVPRYSNPGVPSCLTRLVFIPYGSLPYYLGCYVFPLIFIVGFTGNLLNLIVLNSQGMRTKANCFLSAMAIVDLCFLLMMFVLNLVVYDDLVSSKLFLSFHFMTKMTFIVLANGFSSSSIWFAVVVTVERLVAIRTPLHARSFWKTWRMMMIIGFIIFFSFSLQFFNFFLLTPDTLPKCSNLSERLPYFRLIRLNDSNELVFHYVRISMTLQPILQVTFPLLLLVLLNSMLLRYLWVNRKAVSRFGGDNQLRSSTTHISSVMSKEWKITMTVMIIVITFIIFNLPSVVVYWLSAKLNLHKYPMYTSFNYSVNFLVTVNKALNFVLYCTSSATFRRRLVRLFIKHTNKKRLISMNSMTFQEETKITSLDGLSGLSPINAANRLTKSRSNSNYELMAEKLEMQQLLKVQRSNGFS